MKSAVIPGKWHLGNKGQGGFRAPFVLVSGVSGDFRAGFGGFGL